MGLRPIATPQTVKKALKALTETIKTGGIVEIANVLAYLKALGATKKLSFEERKILDNAKALMLREISLALDLSLYEAQGLDDLVGVDNQHLFS